MNNPRFPCQSPCANNEIVCSRDLISTLPLVEMAEDEARGKLPNKPKDKAEEMEEDDEEDDYFEVDQIIGKSKVKVSQMREYYGYFRARNMGASTVYVELCTWLPIIDRSNTCHLIFKNTYYFCMELDPIITEDYFAI